MANGLVGSAGDHCGPSECAVGQPNIASPRYVFVEFVIFVGVVILSAAKNLLPRDSSETSYVYSPTSANRRFKYVRSTSLVTRFIASR